MRVKRNIGTAPPCFPAPGTRPSRRWPRFPIDGEDVSPPRVTHSTDPRQRLDCASSLSVDDRCHRTAVRGRGRSRGQRRCAELVRGHPRGHARSDLRRVTPSGCPSWISPTSRGHAITLGQSRRRYRAATWMPTYYAEWPTQSTSDTARNAAEAGLTSLFTCATPPERPDPPADHALVDRLQRPCRHNPPIRRVTRSPGRPGVARRTR